MGLPLHALLKKLHNACFVWLSSELLTFERSHVLHIENSLFLLYIKLAPQLAFHSRLKENEPLLLLQGQCEIQQGGSLSSREQNHYFFTKILLHFLLKILVVHKDNFILHEIHVLLNQEGKTHPLVELQPLSLPRPVVNEVLMLADCTLLLADPWTGLAVNAANVEQIPVSLAEVKEDLGLLRSKRLLPSVKENVPHLPAALDRAH